MVERESDKSYPAGNQSDPMDRRSSSDCGVPKLSMFVDPIMCPLLDFVELASWTVAANLMHIKSGLFQASLQPLLQRFSSGSLDRVLCRD